MISHQYKCIFIHIPKCAGSSIERALGHFDNYAGRDGQDHRSIREIELPVITPKIFYSKENLYEVLRRVRYRNSPATNPNSKLTVTRKQYDDYYKFAFIRNPWARAYSWYKNVMRDEIHKRNYQITGDVSLRDFLRSHAGKKMLRPQTYWLKSFDGSINLDKIGRFETLNEDFHEICSDLHISNIALPHEIRGSGEDYTDHYDQESIDIVANVYKEEIDRFGYSF